MDSVFEKITLYDLFAYFVPGVIFMCLTCVSFMPEIFVHYVPAAWDGMTGYVVFVFLIFSYVLGIAISSLTEFLCRKIFRKPEEIDETGLKRALLNSGLQPDEITGIGEGKQPTPQNIALYIYADIQSDSNYKRIHNYTSSENLYRNLFGAFLMSGLLTGLLGSLEDWAMLEQMTYLYVWEAVMAIIFLFRWKRFRKKKMEYAVRWFVGKYLKAKLQ